MKHILFVCHGNICRSPMAQSVMAHLVQQAGRTAEIAVDSAATSTEELGNPVHRGTQRVLSSHGMPCLPHRARQLTRADYERCDLLVCMDGANVRNTLRLLGGDPDRKVCRLLDFANSAADIADPWYTGDFETTFADVLRGCTALLQKI